MNFCVYFVKPLFFKNSNNRKLPATAQRQTSEAESDLVKILIHCWKTGGWSLLQEDQEKEIIIKEVAKCIYLKESFFLFSPQSSWRKYHFTVFLVRYALMTPFCSYDYGKCTVTWPLFLTNMLHLEQIIITEQGRWNEDKLVRFLCATTITQVFGPRQSLKIKIFTRAFKHDDKNC